MVFGEVCVRSYQDDKDQTGIFKQGSVVTLQQLPFLASGYKDSFFGMEIITLHIIMTSHLINITTLQSLRGSFPSEVP